MKIGDLVKTLDSFPTIGTVHSFGYIPHSSNKHVFLVKENDLKNLTAIDLVWNKFKTIKSA